MQKKILLLLADGFEPYEASAFIDVMGWNLIDGDGSTKLYTCGFQKEVKTSFSQKMIVDYLYDEIDIDSFDALAIPGGFEEFNFYNDAFDTRFLEIIRAFKKQQKMIASVCVGALPIGKSDILRGKNGTTYKMGSKRQDTLKRFGVNVVNSPIVRDDKIITSEGPSTAIDVAFLLLEELTSKSNTEHVRQIMGFIEKNT